MHCHILIKVMMSPVFVKRWVPVCIKMSDPLDFCI